MMTNSARERPLNAVGRLVLGTAQFGMAYGITNERGQIPGAEAAALLSDAENAGVRLLDTAVSYGDAETILGSILSLPSRFGIISKIAPVHGDAVSHGAADGVRKAVKDSLNRLKASKLHGLLVHRCADLFKPGARSLLELLEDLKSEGVVAATGVSVYDAEELDRVLEIFRPDIVQLPLNLFDQRLLRSGHLAMLRRAGIEVYCRSIFLQGLLLSPAHRRRAPVSGFSDAFSRYDRLLAASGLSALQACLGFALRESGADYVLVGVTSARELAEIVAAVRSLEKLPDMSDLAVPDLALIDPRTWPPRSRGTAP